MWGKIEASMHRFPERLKVLRVILENGLAIREGRLYVRDIEIPTVKLARVAGTDRRTVAEAVKMIGANPEFTQLFSMLEPAGPSLRKVAKQLGLGVVEIVAEAPSQPGILAAASGVLSSAGINIRQALVDDPELTPEPKLVLIGGKRIPGELMPLLLKIPGVSRVSVE